MDSPDRPNTSLDRMLTLAFGSGDGAHAWKKEMLPEVFDRLAAAGLAVVGGEVWGLRGHAIFGAVPTRQGPTRIFAWSAPGKSPGTDWADYVGQCVQHARRAVRDLNAENEVAPGFRDHLVYHLQFLAEADYPQP